LPVLMSRRNYVDREYTPWLISVNPRVYLGFMNLRWNVRHLAEQQGITSPAQLAKRTGLSWPAANRLWRRRQPRLERIEVGTLQALSVALGVRSPWDLFEGDLAVTSGRLPPRLG
jgi:hypothetical protein